MSKIFEISDNNFNASISRFIPSLCSIAYFGGSKPSFQRRSVNIKKVVEEVVKLSGQ